MNWYKRNISRLIITTMLLGTLNTFQVSALSTYTVKSGDTLWKISQSIGITVNDLMQLNELSSDSLTIGQVIKTSPETHLYTVISGDSLWSIANKFGTSIANLKTINNLTTDSIYVGQILKTMVDTMEYSVKSGDLLYSIAIKFNTTVSEIKSINKLNTDIIYIGQKLLIPFKAQTTAPQNPTPTVTRPTPVKSWPSITYIVKYGDNATVISRKFGVSSSDILKYNYMTASDWFNEGEKIAINGYAPRNYAVVPGEDSAPTKYGHLVDWFFDGKYILRRNTTIKITDLQSGKSFSAKVMGGYNHADIETLTTTDTNIMKQLWGTWNWAPRPVVIYINGMNIAASLSGMPHSFDTISGNGAAGHFDLYLQNSISHSSETSQTYVSQHYANVNKAAGILK